MLRGSTIHFLSCCVLMALLVSKVGAVEVSGGQYYIDKYTMGTVAHNYEQEDGSESSMSFSVPAFHYGNKFGGTPQKDMTDYDTRVGDYTRAFVDYVSGPDQKEDIEFVEQAKDVLATAGLAHDVAGHFAFTLKTLAAGTKQSSKNNILKELKNVLPDVNKQLEAAGNAYTAINGMKLLAEVVYSTYEETKTSREKEIDKLQRMNEQLIANDVEDTAMLAGISNAILTLQGKEELTRSFSEQLLVGSITAEEALKAAREVTVGVLAPTIPLSDLQLGEENEVAREKFEDEIAKKKFEIGQFAGELAIAKGIGLISQSGDFLGTALLQKAGLGAAVSSTSTATATSTSTAAVAGTSTAATLSAGGLFIVAGLIACDGLATFTGYEKFQERERTASALAEINEVMNAINPVWSGSLEEMELARAYVELQLRGVEGLQGDLGLIEKFTEGISKEDLSLLRADLALIDEVLSFEGGILYSSVLGDEIEFVDPIQRREDVGGSGASGYSKARAGDISINSRVDDVNVSTKSRRGKTDSLIHSVELKDNASVKNVNIDGRVDDVVIENTSRRGDVDVSIQSIKGDGRGSMGDVSIHSTIDDVTVINRSNREDVEVNIFSVESGRSGRSKDVSVSGNIDDITVVVDDDDESSSNIGSVKLR